MICVCLVMKESGLWLPRIPLQEVGLPTKTNALEGLDAIAAPVVCPILVFSAKCSTLTSFIGEREGLLGVAGE